MGIIPLPAPPLQMKDRERAAFVIGGVALDAGETAPLIESMSLGLLLVHLHCHDVKFSFHPVDELSTDTPIWVELDT